MHTTIKNMIPGVVYRVVKGRGDFFREDCYIVRDADGGFLDILGAARSRSYPFWDPEYPVRLVPDTSGVWRRIIDLRDEVHRLERIIDSQPEGVQDGN
mgnify:CR=1 FL=1